MLSVFISVELFSFVALGASLRLLILLSCEAAILVASVARLSRDSGAVLVSILRSTLVAL